jgi:hypothetical protein
VLEAIRDNSHGFLLFPLLLLLLLDALCDPEVDADIEDWK